jgi:hypothetical protein
LALSMVDFEKQHSMEVHGTTLSETCDGKLCSPLLSSYKHRIINSVGKGSHRKSLFPKCLYTGWHHSSGHMTSRMVH